MKKGVSAKVGHRWFKPRCLLGLEFCSRCGLVALKNTASEKAIKAGCFAEETVVEDIERNA
jgi:hypothetical protein